MPRKTWADRQGIQTGVWGERTSSGINILEANRATEWELHRAGIEVLRDILHKNYRSKGVNAVLFGVWHGPERLKYAIFLPDGWLRRVE